MKQIFAGEIFEVMPLSGGIIFSYCKEKKDDNIVVAYKMISFDNGRFTDVAKNIYLITKFGKHYTTFFTFLQEKPPRKIISRKNLYKNSKKLLTKGYLGGIIPT